MTRRRVKDPLKQLDRIERHAEPGSGVLRYLFYGALILCIVVVVTIEVIGYLKGRK